uniref:40S ribosomal protein S15 n=1 Tax=Glossina austeni TaxID=7395 RepID=A0A1A9V1L3_GLOAU
MRNRIGREVHTSHMPNSLPATFPILSNHPSSVSIARSTYVLEILEQYSQYTAKGRSIPNQNKEVVKKKRTFKKFTYRGVDLDQLLDKPNKQVVELMHSPVRRRCSRGLKRKRYGVNKETS